MPLVLLLHGTPQLVSPQDLRWCNCHILHGALHIEDPATARKQVTPLATRLTWPSSECIQASFAHLRKKRCRQPSWHFGRRLFCPGDSCFMLLITNIFASRCQESFEHIPLPSDANKQDGPTGKTKAIFTRGLGVRSCQTTWSHNISQPGRGHLSKYCTISRIFARGAKVESLGILPVVSANRTEIFTSTTSNMSAATVCYSNVPEAKMVEATAGESARSMPKRPFAALATLVPKRHVE